MFSKARLFFVVDALILVAFLASAVSGLVLLTAAHGGYQGGRNADSEQMLLSLSRDDWNDIHVWGSLAMIGGIALHLALHWKWIANVLKRLLVPGQGSASLGTAQPVRVAVTDVES